MTELYGVYGYNVNVYPLPKRVLLSVFKNKFEAYEYFNNVSKLNNYIFYEIIKI